MDHCTLANTIQASMYKLTKATQPGSDSEIYCGNISPISFIPMLDQHLKRKRVEIIKIANK